MKKLALVMALALSLLAFSACGTDDSGANDSSVSAVSGTSTESVA